MLRFLIDNPDASVSMIAAATDVRESTVLHICRELTRAGVLEYRGEHVSD